MCSAIDRHSALFVPKCWLLIASLLPDPVFSLVFRVQCLAFSVLFSVFSVQCLLFTVKCLVFTVLCLVLSVERAVSVV